MNSHNAVIPYFPTGRPDELLYSMCAAFQDHMQFPRPHYTMEALFGSKWGHATYDLPNRLGYLVNNLPPRHSYTVDELIDNHTMLPFYSPFCPQERIQRVREVMQHSERGSVHSLLGILYMRQLKFLQFCPLCVEDDTNLFGEPYWHRVHQALGVKVCPIHAVFLEASHVSIQNPAKADTFISAVKGTHDVTPRPLSLNKLVHKILLQISRDALWLLNQKGLVSSSEQLHARWIKILVDKGWATYQGTTSRRKELSSEFLNYYPSEILTLLNCEIRVGKDGMDRHSWVHRLTYRNKQELQPITHYLLFIQFLGHTLEEFFQLSHEFRPFGYGPWPCLNPVCENFKQICIKEFSLDYSITPGHRPVGRFQCACGFTYARLGPDSSSEAGFRFSRVESYGIVWETALKTFWANPYISVHEMARRLGVHDKTVKRQAARLNLPLPRQAVFPIGIGAEITRRRCQPSKVDEQQLYRDEWLAIREKCPEAELKELRMLAPRAYNRLSRYDAKWFSEHCPSSTRVATPRTSGQINWSERDADWSNAILEAANLLLFSPSRPKQITASVLGREIGELTKIRGNLDKLPLTTQALAEVVETPEQIAVRRIHWVTERYREENVFPTRNQFERRAGIYPKVKQSNVVQGAIAAALSTLSLMRSGANGAK
ncbi:TnsD family Tn7-like transposition protein [Leptolyngbya sp. NIES-2104]|uniref:TnsD family Tn7-like transposition protein n=1 Tax=Leptolyngbya sp. NIES-2104 TaxID=1552121 RepID=UPI0006ECAAD2|nr:TnsD family Tn7-like transposition protein [Leptolyngbya sp. NIES-2104]GAP97957.1 Tn7-like transposition protein D [Leptolyngbya sp. NIES-2104]